MNTLTLPKQLTLHAFDDRGALAEALAVEISHQLSRAIQIRGHATMAVSGGQTPVKLFYLLSQAELDWTRITVTLVDERWVDPEDARSNERLVKQNLLIGRAAFAHFIPLYNAGTTVEADAVVASKAIEKLSLPLDVVILGMGEDGHTASFFPDAGNLNDMVDPAASAQVMATESPSSGEPRLTLTAPVLTSSRLIALHIEGEAKRCTFDRALQEGDANALPIRHVLGRNDVNTNIFWAP